MLFRYLLSIFYFSTSVFAGCPVCYDGSVPSNLTLAPRQFQFEDIEWKTCGELLDIASNSSDASNSTRCQEFLNDGYYCGCPVPAESCHLCYDGSQPLGDLTLVVDPLTNFSCLDFVAMGARANMNFSVSGFYCLGYQASYGFDCGCPLPPIDCPICYDGSKPPDLNSTPAGYIGTTCQQEIAYNSFQHPDGTTTSCQDWLKLGGLCNCPVPDDACRLCEDGSDLPNPDTMLGSYTCDENEKYALFEQGENCTANQATLGVYCGCTNPKASTGFCRICGGDTLLPQPDLMAELGDYNYSCAEIESNIVSNLDITHPLSCTELQSNYGSICCGGAPVKNSTTTPATNSSTALATNATTPSKNSTTTPANNSAQGNASVVPPVKAPTTASSGAVAMTRAFSPICALAATLSALGATVALFV